MWVGMRCLASNDKKSRQHCNDWHHFAFLIINQSCKQAFGTLVIFQPHKSENIGQVRDMNLQEQVCLGTWQWNYYLCYISLFHVVEMVWLSFGSCIYQLTWVALKPFLVQTQKCLWRWAEWKSKICSGAEISINSCWGKLSGLCHQKITS